MSPRTRRAVLPMLCLPAGLAMACGEASDPAASDDPPPEVAPMAPFAAFAQPHLYVAALETPIAAPLTPGSTASADLIETSDEGIVSVDPQGALIAHRTGRVVLVGQPGGSALEVEVRVVHELALVPATLRLAPGAAGTLVVMADGAPLPPEAVTWSMSDPATALADDGNVRAGLATGRAEVVADYGGKRASADVVIVPPPADRLALSAPSTRLAQGALVRLTASVPDGVVVTWSSSRPRILESLGGGVFHGLARGRARACVEAAHRSRCVALEVQP